MPLNDLFALAVGPVGALVLALIVVYVLARALIALWREHLKADERERGQRDEAHANDQASKELLRLSLAVHADAVAAWNRRNEQDAARARKSDRGPV